MRAAFRAIIVGVPMLSSGLHAIGAQRVGRASQSVTFRVIAVNHVAVSGAVSLLPLRATLTGGTITPRTSAGGTYGITTNEDGKKIVLSLDKDLPSGIKLSVALAAPSGAASLGPTALTIGGRDAVTGIPVSSETGLPMDYILTRAPDAVEPCAARTVQMTIVSGI